MIERETIERRVKEKELNYHENYSHRLNSLQSREDREVPIHSRPPLSFSAHIFQMYFLRFFSRAGRKPEKFLGPGVCPSEPSKSRSFDPRDLKLTRTPLSKCVSPPCTNRATNFCNKFVAIFVKFPYKLQIHAHFSRRLRLFLFKMLSNRIF